MATATADWIDIPVEAWPRYRGPRLNGRLMHMRAHMDIDAELLSEALHLTGLRTMRETVDLALRELVASRRRLTALDLLRGQVRWEGDLAASRRGRF